MNKELIERIKHYIEIANHPHLHPVLTELFKDIIKEIRK